MIGRCDHSSIPRCEQLARMKGKARDIAVRLTDLFPGVIPQDLTSTRASCIFYDCQVVPAGNYCDRLEITRHPDLVNAENRTCSLVDFLLDECRIDIESPGLDVDKNGLRPAVNDAVGSCNKGMADGDHFIARSHP